ncbi:LRR receptor-like serine/threonine-protein kinase IOS1 isoform X1 [Hevea brasiliensis]|uniref:LRR receptor-like serine/threonine-protein kinase IOS1 isoform X1 n=1 Tax=Hevea brasiliensis TaxID=3981 RepID=UPI0025E90092|nr:LRR receptor-like serine/threonine-protein kinase IOS1 isoform X1 [Hevea brasiliensis]
MAASRKLDGNGISGKKLKAEMEILQCFLVVLLSAIVLTTLAHAQDQTGFISLDCGLPDNATYNDSITSLNYNSDEAFIDTGISKRISSEFSNYSFVRRLQYVRSFPQGNRNCYKLGLDKGIKYLIRATFLYGNYDGQNEIPQFDIHLGTNKWSTVQLEDAIRSFSTEIIHVTARSYVFVCLVNTDSGTPFISALELRPLHNKTYNTETGSLVLVRRLDIGSTTNATVRFPNDIYDRVWQTYNWAKLISSQTDDYQEQNFYHPPSSVMTTAVTSTNATEPLSFSIGTEGSASQYYTYMHFAEIAILQANQSRKFDIYLNGRKWYGPIFPRYLSTNTIFTPSALNGGKFQFSLNKTGDATLPPLINAIEIYTVLELLQPQSDQEDVDAIMNIKSAYRIERNWQGDPCSSPDYLWEGLNCSYNDDDLPRIISLNLSSSGLTGEINRYISNLTLLQSLDLSNNSLTGSVPDFLSKLSSLKFLNLSGNQLTGTVPPALIERSEKSLLVLSVGGNANLCPSLSCKKKKKKKLFTIPVVASVAAVIIVAALVILFWKITRRKQVSLAGKEDAKTNIVCMPLEPKNREFTYSEILNITNNFGRVLGKGGFGTVYHGYLDDTEVAVKMLSPLSGQGSKQFQAEVKLLLTVHHRNLTTLVGFCSEGAHLGLIYEYLARRDLEMHLSGLEYLHNGCKPPIVHRDVKTANILLNDKFQAKLADFGLSRPFLFDGGSHISTDVVGTPGYLDPEYSVTYRLTEKSDVYSFGIVLLRIITGKPVLARTNPMTYLRQWVSSLLANGDIENVVDPRLGGDFNINSVWKAVEIAMACTSPTSTRRPTMLQVVNELNECLAAEIPPTKERHEIELNGSTGVSNESTPLAR